MSSNIYHRISDAGQIIRCTVSEQLITNPDEIIKQLMAAPSAETEARPSGDAGVRCMYNLGDGVSVFRHKVGSYMHYVHSILVGNFPFLTEWALKQTPGINGGRHFICPWDGAESGRFEIGAPMNLPVPDDLIIHFHVEYRRNVNDPDFQQPAAWNCYATPRELVNGIHKYYLTCFSKSRNTCVSLPLPNLYPDSHLCTGTAFQNDAFARPELHTGLVTSARTFLKTWADTTWNRDLLSGAHSLKMAQYRRFVRFDAATGSPLPFDGCQDWEIATAPIPLEDIYRPWSQDTRATPTRRRPEDENLTETGE